VGAPGSVGRPARLGLLDASRFLAAFGVLAFHFTARDNPGWGGAPPAQLGPVGQWASYGRLGVALFFVISGFVLLMTAWGRTLPQFVASRVGRLFPAYWVAVVVSAVLVLAVWPDSATFFGHEFTKGQAALNLTMVQGAFGVPDLDGPYWTLWTEARFYALIALFMLVGINRKRVLAFTVLWPVVGIMAQTSGQAFLSGLLMPEYAPFFAGGMLLYLLHRDGHDLGTWLLVGFQAVVAVNWATATYPGVLAAETPWAPSRTLIALAVIGCFGLVALVTLSPLRRVDGRWMVVAGSLTYPLYLLHENLGWYLIHLLRGVLSPWLVLAVVVPVVLVAAALLHHLVERPYGGRLRAATLRMMEGVGRSGAEAGPAAAAPTDLGPSDQTPPDQAPSDQAPSDQAPSGPARAGQHRQPVLPAARSPRAPVIGHRIPVGPATRPVPTVPTAN
jgi:peptidoglycan/LPS O-acetylase OafA/YrhL